ncbi:MAG: hypothetical protein R3Y50_09430 [Rikenellaceae bacterium]
MESDLNDDGKTTLAQQAENNAYNVRYYIYDIEDAKIEKLEKIRKYNRLKIYKIIYNRDYYEDK